MNGLNNKKHSISSSWISIGLIYFLSLLFIPKNNNKYHGYFKTLMRTMENILLHSAREAKTVVFTPLSPFPFLGKLYQFYL